MAFHLNCRHVELNGLSLMSLQVPSMHTGTFM